MGIHVSNPEGFSTVAVNVDAGANTQLVAAPGADKQIWVYGLDLRADAAGSFALQDEDDTALTGVMPVGANEGITWPISPNENIPWVKVATNKALEIDTVTSTCDGVLVYAIVDV